MTRRAPALCSTFLWLVLVPPAARAGEDPQSAVGKPAPKIELTRSINLEPIPTNENLLGQTVLLEFWDTR